VLLLQCPSLPPRHNHMYFSRASVLSFPRLLPVSPVPVPYCFLADPCLSCARALLLPRQCSASSASRSTAPSITSCLPNPVFFRLDPRVLPPSLQGSFRLVPRVFSSRTPCPLVLSPGFFRPQPRVLSSPIPELSFVCFRNLQLPRKYHNSAPSIKSQHHH